MKRCKSIIGILTTIGLWLVPLAAFASTGQPSIAYAVRALLPANQIDSSLSYFSLKVKPGQEQTLHVKVTNLNDEDIRVSLEANTAFSNQNGLISYVASTDRDESLALDFAQLVTIEEPILLVPAYDSALATFHLRMPQTPFVGDVLGGFTITKLPADTKETEATVKTEEIEAPDRQGMSIRNLYAYTVAVHLVETQETVEPEFVFESAQIGKKAGYTTLVLNIRNPQPLIMTGIRLDARVLPQAGGEAVLSLSNKSLSMAPNTRMPYVEFLTGAQALPAGAYQVELEIYYKGSAWQFSLPLIV